MKRSLPPVQAPALRVLALFLFCLMPRPGVCGPAEIAMVVALQGTASVRHVGLPARPAALYSPLWGGDMVFPAPRSRVTLRFSNGQSRVLTVASPASVRRLLTPPAVPNSPAARLQRAVFDAQCSACVQAGRLVHTTVRGGDEAPPVQTLRPRGRTVRLGLVFQWVAMPGPVHVSLFDSDGKPLWRENVITGNSLAYPADAPPLLPGRDYQWLVGRDGDGGAATQFETASVDAERAIVADLAVLGRLHYTGKEDRRLARAALLAQDRLYVDAAAELQDLTSAQQSPLAHALLLEAWTALGDAGRAAREQKALGSGSAAVCRQWEEQP